MLDADIRLALALAADEQSVSRCSRDPVFINSDDQTLIPQHTHTHTHLTADLMANVTDLQSKYSKLAQEYSKVSSSSADIRDDRAVSAGS